MILSGGLGLLLDPTPARAVVTTTLANWTFENLGSVPSNPGSGPFAANSGTGSLLRYQTTGSPVYTVLTGSAGGKSLGTNSWVVGSGWQFTTSTVNYGSLQLSWALLGSSTGPKNFKLLYSLDGTSYIDLNLTPFSITSASTFQNFSSNLSAFPALNDKATITLRLAVADNVCVSCASPFTIQSGGTNRIDNLLITGTALPPAAVPAPLPALGALVAFGGSRRLRQRIERSRRQTAA